MNKTSEIPSNKKAPSLVGTVSLTAGGHYSVVSHDGNIYAVRHSDYTRAGTDAICEVKDWLCSAMAVIKSNGCRQFRSAGHLLKIEIKTIKNKINRNNSHK
ncbi:hypothetical protein [Morganella morganii]|uniref:hypothetical protein n=1 Tax=Morganella morganii TaxID=582 RepID=UPI0011463FC1|nr:hypothetical protein [Morganella morganii]